MLEVQSFHRSTNPSSLLVSSSADTAFCSPWLSAPRKPSRHNQHVSVKDQPTVEITATLVDPKGISVDFPGGSLSQLLTAISKSSSEPFNLIASSDALALAVPIVRTCLRDLALALDQLRLGYRIDFAGSGDPGASPTIFTLRSNESYPARRTGCCRFPGKHPQLPSRFAGNKLPVHEVIATLNATLILHPGHRPADLRIKHHAATNILLVSLRTIGFEYRRRCDARASLLRRNPAKARNPNLDPVCHISFRPLLTDGNQPSGLRGAGRSHTTHGRG
ncbi:MAG: hypothetical protein QM760_17885 [Nibricoccus sp.]